MLLIGLIITMGIGSSFSTVPLIVAIYTPLCVSWGSRRLDRRNGAVKYLGGRLTAGRETRVPRT